MAKKISKAVTAATIPVEVPTGQIPQPGAWAQPPGTMRAAAVDAFGEIGVTGLRQFSGYLKEEFIRDLIDRNGRAKFHEMLTNHPMIRAGLGTIGAHLRAIPIRVEPASESNEDQRAAELVESCLDDMSLSRDDTFANILTMLPYGWSLMETVYKRRLGTEPGVDERGDTLPTSNHNDGLLGWRKWSPRSQRSLLRWQFDVEGGVCGMYQSAAPDYATRYLPLEKCQLFRTNAINDNPEGDSLLRGCYTSWYTQKQLLFIQAVGFKRDLTGLPVANLPPEIMMATAGTAEAAVRDECEAIVKRLVVDEQSGVVWPAIFDNNGNQVSKLELLASPGTRQSNVKEAIEYFDTRIAQCLFTDFLLFGHTKIGTQSLSTSRIDDVYVVALGGWIKGVLEVINRRAIPQLLQLNGIRVQATPKLTHGRIGNPDLTLVGQYITALAGAGMPMFPSASGELEETLMELAELPVPEVAPPPPMPSPSTGAPDEPDDDEPVDKRAAFGAMAKALVDAARELRTELRKGRAA